MAEPARLRIEAGPARLVAVLRGSGPLVVMVPSLGRGAADFDDLAGRLAAAGFRAVAIEPRGVGRSEGPMEGLTLHDYAADLAATIEALQDGPAHVIGHAFGNRVVRCFATDRPDLARSVTLLGAGGRVPPDAEAAAALGRCFEPEISLDDRMAAAAIAFFAPGNDPRLWSDGWYPEVAAAEGAASRATPPTVWWDAGVAPVLVVQGLQDRIAPPGNGRALKEAFDDRVTLVEVADAGHALLPEKPAAVAEAVIAFLRSH